MLSLEDITLETGEIDAEGDARKLLDGISLRMRRGQLVGVVGPSGCGKSTLLKLIAGLAEPTGGTVRWDGRDLATEGDLPPSELGYVPQFSIAHDLLTVHECVDYAARLRLAGLTSDERADRVDELLRMTGLDALADRQARVLSGGQRRRLSLAIEMVSAPSLLLCDEVTSGLDPGSAHEILTLLHTLARTEDGARRIVVNVTHSLADLHLYDLILVLFEGVVVFNGAPEYLAHYFRAEKPDEVFARLGKRGAQEWQASWKKHGRYFETLTGGEPDAEHVSPEDNQPAPGPFESLVSAKQEMDAAMRYAAERRAARRVAETRERELAEEAAASTPESDVGSVEPIGAGQMVEKSDGLEASRMAETGSEAAEGGRNNERDAVSGATPGMVAQFWVVFERRLRLFVRDRTQLGLQVGLILGFPCLVVIFALNGLPAIHNLSLQNNLSIVDQFRESAKYMTQAFKVGGLVSGLLLFQIILLALMGSNNSALEIAGERPLLESEKLAGLSSVSYVAAKGAFLALLVTVQSVWMVLFVHLVCGFPGDLFGQIGLLWLADAALTAVCLAFSSLARTPSQASLISIYFVGFQLPLSGAVLALPEWIARLTQPFIAAYWSWSGGIQTMLDTRFYDLIKETAKTELSAMPTCYWVLGAHVALGLGVAYLGCRRSQWQ